MDFPDSIKDLAAFYQADPEDIYLLCLGCKKELSSEELHVFDAKEFRVLWRRGCPFGFCNSCIGILALHDFCLYRECTLEGDGVEKLTGISLVKLQVRCINCLGALSATEKLGCAKLGVPFSRVRQQWRGLCRKCYEGVSFGCGIRA
nr:E6 [Erethizon dorsatum papillomavirus 2]